MKTKIRQLTASNVYAIKTITGEPAYHFEVTDIGATYATFVGTPADVLASVQAAMDDYDAMGMAKGHPRSSLVAVRNKLRDAAANEHWAVPALGEDIKVTAYVSVLP